ncbi:MULTISPECIES: hypothetical protein [Haloferax]|uniref:Uncharacterized protein n=2 Tax=Haloferax TaxID=2251 RepID=A0ACD5HVT5_9EURY|nr:MULTISPECIES: hypothetical protein [Haloferax]MBC9986679.1 hypothetical protein [Haloferax sp. AS1]QIB78978.1 hypothetical protein G3A49_12855 [Haloferax alexandrinus]RDZ35376.1 hypothetical protein C5B88_13350 [Haloferax sp. Atlit-24N]RDZ39101.1 hypothetical protein C5B89_11225 [Haloferax sp. Atlit-47N]RLM35787.1 hypothetical protein DVK03_13360 [Haloferax sp. Atlit-109R]
MTTEPTATRVVVSFPDELSAWGHDQLTADRFVTYLRRVHEDAAPGDEWEEFLDVGCCGDSLTLTLRVEELDPEGATRIDDETTVEFVEREGSVHGGWCVQSADGPVSSTAEQR